MKGEGAEMFTAGVSLCVDDNRDILAEQVMHLSNLTNPKSPELEKPESAPVSGQISLQSMLNSEPESRTESNTTGTNDELSTDVKSDSQSNKDDSGDNEVVDSNLKQRSTSEYRSLYNYLLEKFKNVNQTAKVLDDFELYLKNLAKYQQLRNNMLIDSLIFLNKHESITPMDPTSHTEIIQKLKSIQKKAPIMHDFLGKLMELESSENETDSRLNINSFHNLLGINDSLSSDLAVQEQNTYPDLYPGKFDSFELVKKNQRYEHNIKTLTDWKKQIKIDCKEPLPITETEPPTRKRKAGFSNVSSPLVSATTDVKADLASSDEIPIKKIKL